MKNSRTVIQKRHSDILRLLREHGTMEVTGLAGQLGVTATTIRRDLTALEEDGTVVRSFGKVCCAREGSMEEIEPTNIEDEKELVRRAIARRAAELVEDGDVLFLNSSGTASLVIEYLGNKNVTVLTNNARIMKRAKAKNVQLLLTGGEIYGKKQSLIGQFALDTISRVVATKCILGVSGISGDGKMTSIILPETQVNHLMLQQCNGDKIVVAEGSKIGVVQNFFTGNTSEVTHLVTDRGADAATLEQIRQTGVETLVI